jgi:hypothetical protein
MILRNVTCQESLHIEGRPGGEVRVLQRNSVGTCAATVANLRLARDTAKWSSAGQNCSSPLVGTVLTEQGRRQLDSPLVPQSPPRRECSSPRL